jgi:hypothetical protein
MGQISYESRATVQTKNDCEDASFSWWTAMDKNGDVRLLNFMGSNRSPILKDYTTRRKTEARKITAKIFPVPDKAVATVSPLNAALWLFTRRRELSSAPRPGRADHCARRSARRLARGGRRSPCFYARVGRSRSAAIRIEPVAKTFRNVEKAGAGLLSHFIGGQRRRGQGQRQAALAAIQAYAKVEGYELVETVLRRGSGRS